MPLALAGAIVSGLAITPALAEMLAFKADLKGAGETPPADSTGTGTAQVNIDTDKKEVTWTIQYSGLTGDATAAHFHGAAAAGEKAGPEIDISGRIENGSAPLTDAQLADFQAGKIYVNIHTAKFPDGEIRGQVEQ
jgi:CHRD domain